MERFVALFSLVVLMFPSVLFLAGVIGLDRVKQIMLVATVIWFASATLWMWNSRDELNGQANDSAEK